MAQKKSFKDNPALQFITTPTDDRMNTDNTDNTHNTDNTDNTHNTDNTQQERKTKRLNLLLQPSVLEALTKIARMKQGSVNNLINTVLKEYAKEQAETVERYDRIFSGKERQG